MGEGEGGIWSGDFGKVYRIWARKGGRKGLRGDRIGYLRLEWIGWSGRSGEGESFCLRLLFIEVEMQNPSYKEREEIVLESILQARGRCLSTWNVMHCFH